MSTRSNIGIKRTNGGIDVIYCHSDGYIEWNGLKLYRHYNDINKIEELIGLGDISSLHEKLAPEEWQEHSFDNRQEGITVAYHRDRGEDWERVQPQHYSTLEEYMEEVDSAIEYIYLYDEESKRFVYREIVYDNIDNTEFRVFKDLESQLLLEELITFEEVSKNSKTNKAEEIHDNAINTLIDRYEETTQKHHYDMIKTFIYYGLKCNEEFTSLSKSDIMELIKLVYNFYMKDETKLDIGCMCDKAMKYKDKLLHDTNYTIKEFMKEVYNEI